MALRASLQPEDREFFSLWARMIFTNPFSDERAESEALLSLPQGRAPGKGRHPFTAMLPALNSRIRGLERRGVGVLQRFQGEDRTLVEYAFLFQVYHQYLDDLDELIELQLAAGDEPAKAPFAEAVLVKLRERGLSEEESLGYLGLFYQLRRAYYFIDHSLVGDSPSMRQLRLALWNNVFTRDVRTYFRHLWNRMEDFSTLLLGETGTGKGSAAGAIGRSGYIPFDRKRGHFAHSFTRTFVAINLSEFPESLIESELFGHRKGAFTGAVENHEGLFERCSVHGALFVDEIGEVSVPVQIKLLNILQNRTFSPVGSHETKRFTGRVIAATNKSLRELRRARTFRDDFFYRLCSDVIVVPPLRQRMQESPSEFQQLVDLLVTRMTGRRTPKLTGMVLEALKRDLPKGYPWPGNVRELEQAVRRVLLTGHYAGDLFTVGSSLEDTLVSAINEGELQAKELLSRYCAVLYGRLGTFEDVARRTGLDRRTVKKYLETA
jgi:DNA-binding NtrC family response regulator